MLLVVRFPSRKNKCEYRVFIDLSCVAVIHDSKE